MKTPQLPVLLYILLLTVVVSVGCHSRQEPSVDITPHRVDSLADILYQKAVFLMQRSYDVDSARKCICYLDQALALDSLNPDYYGVKAKLLSELGELDSALSVQTLALQKSAITGEYLFQLGLFQAAKELNAEAHESFGKSLLYFQAILKQYPDSLGAFILSEAANALYLQDDSLFCRNIDEIRQRFSTRLLEIEMTRRVKPQALIRQIRNIQIKKENHIDFDLDSLVLDAVQKSES